MTLAAAIRAHLDAAEHIASRCDDATEAVRIAAATEDAIYLAYDAEHPGASGADAHPKQATPAFSAMNAAFRQFERRRASAWCQAQVGIRRADAEAASSWVSQVFSGNAEP